MSDTFLLRLDSQGKKDRKTLERSYKKSFNRILLDLMRRDAERIGTPMFAVDPQFAAGTHICHCPPRP